MSKFVETEFLNKKEILKFPDHFVAIAVMVDDDGVTANEDGKKIVPAGTIVGGKNAPVLENLDEPVVDKNTPPAKATKQFTLYSSGGTTHKMTLTAKEPGTAGNSITFAMSKSTAASGDEVEVEVTSSAIVVKPVVADNAITSTIGEILEAINSDEDASALVEASAPAAALDIAPNQDITATALENGSNGTITGAEGVLLNDVDVTYGPAPGAMVIHGFIDLNKIPEPPAFGYGEDVLPMIKFIK